MSGGEYKLIGTTEFRIQSGENITVRGTVTVCSFYFDQGFPTTVRMIFLKVIERVNEFLIQFIVVCNENRKPYLHPRKLQLANQNLTQKHSAPSAAWKTTVCFLLQ